MTFRNALLAFIAALLPVVAQAQEHTAAKSAGPSAPVIPAAAEQVAGAVMAAPEEFRAGAQVLGYAPDGKFVGDAKARTR